MTNAEHEICKIRDFLVGGTIGGTFTSPPHCGITYYGFEVKSAAGETLAVWVYSDPEGNDAGSLKVETVYQRTTKGD